MKCTGRKGLSIIREQTSVRFFHYNIYDRSSLKLETALRFLKMDLVTWMTMMKCKTSHRQLEANRGGEAEERVPVVVEGKPLQHEEGEKREVPNLKLWKQHKKVFRVVSKTFPFVLC